MTDRDLRLPGEHPGICRLELPAVTSGPPTSRPGSQALPSERAGDRPPPWRVGSAWPVVVTRMAGVLGCISGCAGLRSPDVRLLPDPAFT